MHPALRLGLEVPPFSAAAEREGEMSLREVALAAEDAGVGTIWLSEGGVGSLDPVPLAGALARVTTSVTIGVIARPSHGRHPSVLARDVSTVDRLSGGRAAVGLVEDGGAPSDLERLAEAVGILHRLLTESEVTAAGRFYEVAELTTRPRPVTPAGPPVVAGFLGPAVGDAEPAEPLLEAGTDAIVACGSEDEVARARRRVDGLATAGAVPGLLWRGGLPGGPEEAARVASSLGRAGADGLIVTLERPAVRGLGFVASEVGRALETLAAVAASPD